MSEKKSEYEIKMTVVREGKGLLIGFGIGVIVLGIFSLRFWLGG